MTTQKLSQCRLIARHLENGFMITAREASQLYGCGRLAARINDLRNERYFPFQHMIKTEMIQLNGKHFGRYLIVKQAK